MRRSQEHLRYQQKMHFTTFHSGDVFNYSAPDTFSSWTTSSFETWYMVAKRGSQSTLTPVLPYISGWCSVDDSFTGAPSRVKTLPFPSRQHSWIQRPTIMLLHVGTLQKQCHHVNGMTVSSGTRWLWKRFSKAIMDIAKYIHIVQNMI